MTRLLSNREICDLITVEELIEPMADAFGEFSLGDIKDFPRERIYTTVGDKQHRFNNMMGTIPSLGITALRIDSDHFIENDTRKENIGDYVGLILLFDIEQNDLVGILHDSYLSGIRVAATTAAAASYLAPKNSRMMGLFGTGKQAMAQVKAFHHVCEFCRIEVYSPTREHRDKFANYYDNQLSAEVVAIEEPRTMVERSDVLVTATSSSSPVFDGRWLTPGTHISTTVNGDKSNDRDEIDSTSVTRARRIYCQHIDTLVNQRQGNVYKMMENNEISRDDIHELGELVLGEVEGRTSDEEITIMKPNCGMGLQFAVPGSIVLERANEANVGKSIPSEWFTTQRKTEGWIPEYLVHSS